MQLRGTLELPAVRCARTRRLAPARIELDRIPRRDRKLGIALRNAFRGAILTAWVTGGLFYIQKTNKQWECHTQETLLKWLPAAAGVLASGEVVRPERRPPSAAVTRIARAHGGLAPATAHQERALCALSELTGHTALFNTRDGTVIGQSGRGATAYTREAFERHFGDEIRFVEALYGSGRYYRGADLFRAFRESGGRLASPRQLSLFGAC